MPENNIDILPDFIHGGAFFLKSLGYTIVEDMETGDVHWVSKTGEKCHLIISWEARKNTKGIGIVVTGNASDRYTRMVEEVQEFNDNLRETRAKEQTENTKNHLHKWIEKIKSQWLLNS